MPTVTSTVPTMAPEIVRIPPTTSMASTITDNSKLNWVGFTVPSDWLRMAPPRPTSPALTTRAANRVTRRSIPMAPAASSSSRPAWAKRPMGEWRKAAAATTAVATASRIHVRLSSRGTLEMLPAPLVRSIQFSATASVTNRKARVIMVAASPLVRAITRPRRAPMTTAAATPSRVATSTLISTFWMPQGALGSSTALRVAGTASRAQV